MMYDDFLKLMKYRRSIRSFKPDPVPDDHITKILDAAHYAMSGANSQPWEFVVVRDPGIKKRLHDAWLVHHRLVESLEQMRTSEYRHPAYHVLPEEEEKTLGMLGSWVNAPVVIAVLEDPRKQFGSVLAAFLPPGEVLTESMAHCTMVMHLAAASLGLGSQRVDVTIQQPFREALGFPEPLRLNILVPVGYRASEPGEPRRLPLEELVHFERYDMTKYLQDKDFLKHLKRIRTLSGPAYRAVIEKDKG